MAIMVTGTDHIVVLHVHAVFSFLRSLFIYFLVLFVSFFLPFFLANLTAAVYLRSYVHVTLSNVKCRLSFEEI